MIQKKSFHKLSIPSPKVQNPKYPEIENSLSANAQKISDFGVSKILDF